MVDQQTTLSNTCLDLYRLANKATIPESFALVLAGLFELQGVNAFFLLHTLPRVLFLLSAAGELIKSSS